MCDLFFGMFQSPQGNSELLKTICIHQKMSALHKLLPMGLFLKQLQGPSAVGQSTRGRGEENFLLESLRMGRSHRRQIMQSPKGNCKPMQASA